MCIAILRLQGAKKLTKEQFDNSWDNNPDGYGAIWVRNKHGKKTLETYKTLKRKDAKKHFMDIQQDDEVENIAFHFRWATHGGKNLENCHPFDAGHGFYIIHNGILPLDDKKKLKSDTAIFAERMRGYQKDWIENKNTIKKLEDFCAGNKVVFLSTQKHFIVNEKLGYWEQGIWYSNDAHTYSWKNTTSHFGYFPNTKKDVISEGVDYGIEEGDTISSLYIDELRSLIDKAYLNSEWDEVIALEDELDFIEENCFISDDSYTDDDDWIPHSNKGFHFVNDYLCKNS